MVSRYGVPILRVFTVFSFLCIYMYHLLSEVTRIRIYCSNLRTVMVRGEDVRIFRVNALLQKVWPVEQLGDEMILCMQWRS